MKKIKYYAIALIILIVPLITLSQVTTTSLADLLKATVQFSASEVSDAPIGSIIYDKEEGAFRGRALDGSWQNMTTPISSSSVFYVDANIGGDNPNLGTSNITSYSEITNGNLILTNNSLSSTAQIACASGTSSSGTTCSSDESLGIAFTIPEAGAYTACASFSHVISLPSTANVGITSIFQIIETPNNATTIISQGNSRISSGLTNTDAQGTNITNPLRVCGIFVFSTTGQKTLRLMYEQNATVATPTGNSIFGDEDSAAGQRDIHWEVFRIR